MLYLVLYSHRRGKYYLQLTADVVARKDYLLKLDEIIFNHTRVDWFEIKLSGIPLAAALFQSKDILPLTDHAIQHLPTGDCSDFVNGYIDEFYKKCSSKNVPRCTETLEHGQVTIMPSVFVPKHMAAIDEKDEAEYNYLATRRRHANYTFDCNIPVRYEYWLFDDVPVYINSSATITTYCVGATKCTLAALNGNPDCMKPTGCPDTGSHYWSPYSPQTGSRTVAFVPAQSRNARRSLIAVLLT